MYGPTWAGGCQCLLVITCAGGCGLSSGASAHENEQNQSLRLTCNPHDVREMCKTWLSTVNVQRDLPQAMFW